MVNLLPPKEKRALILGYYLKLGATISFASAIVVVIGALLIVPSYVVVTDRAEASATYLRALETAQAARQKSDTAKTVATLSERLTILKKFERKPVAAEIISTLEKNLPRDMTVGSIKVAYTDDTHGTISLSGIAKTRTSLLSYAESLREEKIFTGVTVPVTQLANDANLKYTLDFGFTAP